jgi:hypothetical protein
MYVCLCMCMCVCVCVYNKWYVTIWSETETCSMSRSLHRERDDRARDMCHGLASSVTQHRGTKVLILCRYVYECVANVLL